MSPRSWSAVRASACATPGPSCSLEHRQHRVADADPDERGVLVVYRVLPDPIPSTWQAVTVSARGRSSRGGRTRRRTAASRERAAPGAAGQAQQHGLRLVVTRGRGGRRTRRRVRRSPRAPRSGVCRAAVAFRPEASGLTLTAAAKVSSAPSSAICATTRRRARPTSCRPWSTVAPTTATPPCALEDGGREQREARVRAAGRRRRRRSGGVDVGQRAAHRPAYGGDGRVQAHAGLTAPG